MTETFSPTLIGAVAIAIAVGVLIGVGLMLLIQRSQTGGKTLASMQQQQEDYEQSVEQHFERSAVLFKKLTDDYREFYEHMASSAHTLCKKDEPVIQPLELARPQGVGVPSPAQEPETPVETPAAHADSVETGDAPDDSLSPLADDVAAPADANTPSQTDTATDGIAPEKAKPPV